VRMKFANLSLLSFKQWPIRFFKFINLSEKEPTQRVLLAAR
jgi:hypothetical protein